MLSLPYANRVEAVEAAWRNSGEIGRCYWGIKGPACRPNLPQTLPQKSKMSAQPDKEDLERFWSAQAGGAFPGSRPVTAVVLG